jgi:hypothetical protein
MRTQLLCIALAGLFFYSANATVRTVGNTPTSTIAQFNTISAAIAASASGDTIYVHGSPNSYAGFSISNKKLTIIGPGWSPDKNNSFGAVVGTSSISGNSSTGCEIQGLYFNGNLSISAGVDSIRIIRNRFSTTMIIINTGGSTYRSYLFEGNYFDFGNSNPAIAATTSSVYQNFVIQNNVFFSLNSGSIGSQGGHLDGFSQATNTVLVDHNLFYGPQNSGNSTNAFTSCSFLILSNNIFFHRNVSVSNSFFNNNLTFETGTNTPWIGNNNTNSAGNLANTDPQMAGQANFATSVNNNPLHDFTIASGPANNTGSDGKDIGLLYDASGSLNWANSRNSRLPRIFSMNIATPVNPAGGTINVTVEGRKSN